MSGDAAVSELNLQALELMSGYLTQHPRFITEQDVEAVAACGVTREEAVVQLLCAACGLDARRPLDRRMIEHYVRPSLARLDPAPLRENPYMRRIRFPQARQGRWEMTHMAYEPYELFVRDDLLCLPDGREIPRLGYFDRRFAYPAVLEGGREWMTVTPNEVATMAPALAQVRGRVAVMGLGLGYFAFMASESPDVRAVTVIERDADVIALFERHILPQLAHRDKVRLVRADAFEFAQAGLDGFDCAFVDLWHDVSDGAPMYLRMKALEARSPGTRFFYWIETSIRCFLRSLGRSIPPR